MLNNELILIKPTRHKDERGFFSEIYSQRRYRELGVNVDFQQENHSFSWEVGTLRGLHFQAPPNAQGKLVRCGRERFLMWQLISEKAAKPLAIGKGMS